MWNNTLLEEYMIVRINEEQECTEKAELLLDRYMQAKNYLCINIYPNIYISEPDLTDHGPQHIKNVLQNAHRIIKHNLKNYSSIDLYILVLSILFHDVGNYYTRKDHKNLVHKILNRTNFPCFHTSEIREVINITKCHSGEFSQLDCLIDTNMHGIPLKIRDITAVLRFADECAEGPQRANNYKLDYNYFLKSSSRIYHEYASITELQIIENKIAISYHFYLENYTSEESTSKMVKFCIKRLEKLFYEKLNCSYYSQTINNISSVNITIKCYNNEKEFIQIGDIINFEIENRDLLIAPQKKGVTKNEFNKISDLWRKQKRK